MEDLDAKMDFSANLRRVGNFLRVVCVLTISVPLLLAARVLLALDNTPMVAGEMPFTPDNVDRAKRLIDRNDPRKMRAGVLRTIMVRQDDWRSTMRPAAMRMDPPTSCCRTAAQRCAPRSNCPPARSGVIQATLRRRRPARVAEDAGRNRTPY
jgi:hypothetical protein